jgi:hypothetical protein
MALLKEAYDRGFGASFGSRSGFQGLRICFLGLREVSEKNKRGKEHAKWPPHKYLRPPQIGLDYTSTLRD